MEILKQLRKEKGLTQSEVAKILNITVSAYGNYELNQREPSIEYLIKLSDFYGVSVDFLIGHSKSKSPQWNEEERALGVGMHATYLSDEEWEWLELGSEIKRVKGEDYFNTVKVMLNAVIEKK